jgi:hypothetical protein
MDKERACELLRDEVSGVRQWNAFRKANELIPDLSGANLSRCHLVGVDLHEACLRGAWFGGSALDGANLSGADLRGADLPACRLFHADLRGADLREANLRSADVTLADLTGADLTGANLLGVKFSLAQLVELGEVGGAIDHVEELPLDVEVRHALKDMLQTFDFGKPLKDDEKSQLAVLIDDLTKELLTCPPNSENIVELLDNMHRIAPSLVTEIFEKVFTGTRPKPTPLGDSATTGSPASSS